MNNKPINKENFNSVLKALNLNLKGHEDFIYAVYSYTIEGIQDLVDSNVLINFQGVNHLEIIGYCIGECQYYINSLVEVDLEKIMNDEDLITRISSIVADKYLSLSQFSYSETSIANRFTPPISTLYVYVNFMLNAVKGYHKKDPMVSLFADLYMKSMSMCKCTLDLLTRGFETEAFSTWRTLHECECTLIVLLNNGQETISSYLKHMNYSMAFKNIIVDKAKQDQIFLSMKEEMKQYDLKSKDIKKYIEYGWLYSVKGVKEDASFKLNFRDGLEKIAGLSMYSKRYEMSSEIIHGTPLLIYSNREYFYFITLLSTYESFFRLENIFAKLLVKSVDKDKIDGYKQMREIYYTHLINIHKREAEHFQRWQKLINKK